MKTVVLAVLLAMVSIGFAQPPYVVWDRTYGGEQDDFGRDILAVDSTGCIILGTTASFGVSFHDIYLLCINNEGDTLWTRTVGGFNDDQGYSVIQTDDQSLVMCGRTSSSSYLVKTDLNGNLIWQRTLTGFCGYRVIQTSDGGFAFTGASSSSQTSQILLVKTYNDGTEDWSRTYAQGVGYGVQQTPDGGFLIAGETGLEYETNIYVVRTDYRGDTLWTRIMGSEYEDAAYDLKRTPDGGYIITGYSNAYNPPVSYGCEVLLIRLDVYGDSLWTQTYSPEPGVIGPDYWGRSVVLTRDGGYLVVGNGTFWIDQWSAFGEVLKTDSLGNQEWFRCMGGGGWMGGGGLYGVTEIDDGDYIAAGTRCVNLDSTGCNVEVIRFSEYTGVPKIRSSEPQSYKLHEAYPNPFNSFTTISYEVPVMEQVHIAVYNLLGQRVSTLQKHVVEPGRHEVNWNARDLPSGIYFCRMQAGKISQVRKIVLLK